MCAPIPPTRTTHRRRQLLSFAAVLALTTVALAGCLAGPRGDDARDAGDTNGADPGGNDADDGSDGAGGGTGEGSTGMAGDEGPEDAGSGGDSDGSDDASGQDPRSTRKDPVAPSEAEQGEDDTLDRPGEYRLLPYREDRDPDVSLDVPVLGPGDRWTHEITHERIDEICAAMGRPSATGSTHEREYRVTGTGESHDTPTYTIERTWSQCGGEPSEPVIENWTRAHLEAIAWDDGFAKHDLLFPLEDGKRWLYVDDLGRNVSVEVFHETSHQWLDGTTPAWHMVTHLEDDDSSRTHRWFVGAAKTVVTLELRVDDHCTEPHAEDEPCPEGAEEDDYLFYRERLASYEI